MDNRVVSAGTITKTALGETIVNIPQLLPGPVYQRKSFEQNCQEEMMALRNRNVGQGARAVIICLHMYLHWF